jgi:Icc-related predicted phosphoesterase
MKLHILSDLHRDLSGDIEIPDTDSDLVILAGDIDSGFESIRWAIKSFDKPTLFVAGNHEMVAGNKNKLQDFRDLARDTQLTVLDNEVFEYNTVRFLGCTLWAPANRRMRDSMNESISWLEKELARPYQGKTVVISHYSPLHESLDYKTIIDTNLAQRISVDLRELIESSDITLWVHGHIHKKQDYYCGKTRVVCNPRGYADMLEAHFNPQLVIEI